jgi:hypothetical protein
MKKMKSSGIALSAKADVGVDVVLNALPQWLLFLALLLAE